MHLSNCSGLKVAFKSSSFDGLFLFCFFFFFFFVFGLLDFYFYFSVDSRCNLI